MVRAELPERYSLSCWLHFLEIVYLTNTELMVQKSGDHHLGFTNKTLKIMEFQLPTSTGESRISEPSTGFLEYVSSVGVMNSQNPQKETSSTIEVYCNIHICQKVTKTLLKIGRAPKRMHSPPKNTIFQSVLVSFRECIILKPQDPTAKKSRFSTALASQIQQGNPYQYPWIFLPWKYFYLIL